MSMNKIIAHAARINPKLIKSSFVEKIQSHTLLDENFNICDLLFFLFII